MRAIYLLLIPVLFFVGCTHTARHSNIVPQPYIAYKNIVYGTDSAQQAMDVYLPMERHANTTPVIILLHGGAWVVGDKTELNWIGLDTFFTAHGCAVVNMNYRLHDQYAWPAPLDDIGIVMSYIKAKAAEWKINADKVCLWGKSSGAHLALVYGYSRNSERRVKVVMDLYGPSDLTDSSVVYKDFGMNVAYLLGDYTGNRYAWQNASPLYFMNSAVPTAIYHGTADSLIYFTQAQRLFDSLRTRGVPCTLTAWSGRSHGWYQEEWLHDRDAAMAWVQQFLK